MSELLAVVGGVLAGMLIIAIPLLIRDAFDLKLNKLFKPAIISTFTMESINASKRQREAMEIQNKAEINATKEIIGIDIQH